LVVSGAGGRIGRTMKILPESVGLCSTCGRPLNVNSECLPCLVRIAFDEPAEAATAPPASLVFGDFEVEQRPDGFYWELGHGAMGVTYLATSLKPGTTDLFRAAIIGTSTIRKAESAAR
jgi:hypothetical protein